VDNEHAARLMPLTRMTMGRTLKKAWRGQRARGSGRVANESRGRAHRPPSAQGAAAFRESDAPGAAPARCARRLLLRPGYAPGKWQAAQ